MLLLVELVTPGAPIELVLPVVPVEPLVPPVPAVLEVSLPVAGGVGVVVALRSVVVLDVLDDVDGVAVSSRLVQAPRETAATNARAAHEVRDAFIRKLLEWNVVWGFARARFIALLRTLGTLHNLFVGLSRRYL